MSAQKLERADSLVSGNSEDNLDCIFAGQIINVDSLKSQYGKFRDPNPAENMVGADLKELSVRAREAVGIPTPGLRVVQPKDGLWRFPMKGAAHAVSFCEKMVDLVDEYNHDTPNAMLHLKIAFAIVGRRKTDQAASEEDLLNSDPAMVHARSLLIKAEPGEVRLSNEVFALLPQELQAHYERIPPDQAPTGDLAQGAWRRKGELRTLSFSLDKFVMRFDMAHYGEILGNLGRTLGTKIGIEASAVLKKHILSILEHGFQEAGVPAFERFLLKELEGDGGYFAFRDAQQAHKVAVGLIKETERSHNSEPRRSTNPADAMALRCFRIGIARGILKRDGAGDIEGAVLTEAKRLESGGPSGEIRVSESVYSQLPEAYQREFGAPEQIVGKHGETPIAGRRHQVCARGPWPDDDVSAWPLIAVPNPDFKETKAPPPVLQPCFVVSPREPRGRSEEVFQSLIVPACRKVGLNPVRATDINIQMAGKRSAVIAKNLETAAMVIGYLGSPDAAWNANVILELGYRLAMQKPMVLMSECAENGDVPAYEQLLPFQLRDDNVITVARDPAQSIEALETELLACRSRRPPSEWFSVYPVIEFKFTDFSDATVVDANEAAKDLFGGTVTLESIRKMMVDRMDPAQADAVKAEGQRIAEEFDLKATYHRENKKRQVCAPTVPLVFRDMADPATGKPVGFLPLIVRWDRERDVKKVRYLYVRVSASMRLHKGDAGEYYVCDL